MRFEHDELPVAMAGLPVPRLTRSLSRLHEGDEVSERRVLRELRRQTGRAVDPVPSLGGLLRAGVVPFERPDERPAWLRRRPTSAAEVRAAKARVE